MTEEKLRQAIVQACSHCAKGHKPRYRENVGEWVHDFDLLQGRVTSFSTTVCGATKIRRFGVVA